MKMTPKRYSFKLKNELSELKTLSQHLTHFSQVYGLSNTTLSEINICLDELFTNIVLHGYKDDLAHLIRFSIFLNNNSIILNVEDDGIPFNPFNKIDSELPADLNSAKIGGLGIHIVKELMDDIWYQRKRGKNRLTLKKINHARNYLYKRNKSSNIPSKYMKA